MDISYINEFFSKNKIPNPEKYNNNIASDNNNCVKGSVEGVNIAPRIVENSIIYLHAPNIWFGETIFNNPTKI
jgi:hypothetical protein